jgi:hypothetical protein
MKKLFIPVLCFAVLVGLGACGGDDDTSKQAADGGGGLGGDTEGTAGTGGAGGGAGTAPVSGAGGAGEGGGAAGTSPVGGAGGAGAGGAAGEPVAGDGGVAGDSGVSGMDAATGNACEQLAACCETAPVAERATCRSIAETSIDEGCAVYLPLYCVTDGGPVPEGGLTSACQELADCCAIQTSAMVQRACEFIANGNDEANCETVLTSDLSSLFGGGTFATIVPCN